MRYFLSSLDSSGGGLALGIPSDAVASLLYFSGEAGGLVEEDEDEQRFSLPYFFGFGGEETRYGIVLKGEGKRRVLLLTAVDREVEFSPGQLYSPPPIFGVRGGLSFLTGLLFQPLDSGDFLPVLVVDPFKLVDIMLDRSGTRCSMF
ncbi:MAG: hypothetical protein LBU19_08395 [Treponema sp.]|jgi:hypothetical protein|nr:hypothetical protein [Treponema sp.]